MRGNQMARPRGREFGGRGGSVPKTETRIEIIQPTNGTVITEGFLLTNHYLLKAPDPPPQKADASAEQAPADLINIFECKFTPTRTITDVEKKRKTGKKTHHPSMTNPDSDIGTPTSEASPTKPKRRLVFLMKALETRQDMKGINLANDYNQHLYTLTALPLTVLSTPIDVTLYGAHERFAESCPR